MARIESISVVSVPVSDQDKAKTYYTEVLGFKVVNDSPMMPGARWIQLAPEGAETSITLVTWFEWLPAGSIGGNVLKCDDIHAVHASLKNKGVEISDVDSQPWGLFASFKDPDGNGWILMGESPSH